MGQRSGYGQFCPVAKAAEIVAERWTPLVLREILVGSTSYSQIHRGVPLMSPALLTLRLRQLEQAGVIERRAGKRGAAEYHPTKAGRELQPIIELLGVWGYRWALRELGPEDLDPALLVNDIGRRAPKSELPPHRFVVRFDLRGTGLRKRLWWLVFDGGAVDFCLKDPGHPVDLHVEAHIRAITEVWLRKVTVDAALAAGSIALSGAPEFVRGFKRWFACSHMATLSHHVGPEVFAPLEKSGSG